MMSTKCSFTVRNDSGDIAQSLRVSFAFSPTGIRNANILLRSADAAKAIKVTTTGYELDIDWGQPMIPECAEITFEVESDHSPIMIATTTWSPTSQPRLEDSAMDDDKKLFEKTGEFIDFEDTCEEIDAGVGEAVGKDCKKFFEEYDKRFMPDVVKKNTDMTSEQRAERIATVGNLLPVLLKRRDERAKAAKTGKAPDPKDMPRRGFRDDVEHLSEAQKALFKECFPDGKGGIDYKAFQLCFEKFANGEFRNPAKPGEREPDGGFFFLFAEFAFLAITLAVDLACWKKLLRTFAKSQEIFIPVYRPAGVPPFKLDDYQARNFRGGQSEDRKKELREKYDDMTPGQLEKEAEKNMKQAQDPK